MKRKAQFVFVILVYRNYTDLVELIINIKTFNLNCELIVVNSYYDDKSFQNIKKVSTDYNCSFINVENKGYGYGNNRGIEFAINNIDYEYLIVSNPDIIINKFNVNKIIKHQDVVLGPIIKTSSIKSQNPYWAIKNNLGEKLIYQGYKRKRKLVLYSGIAMNKLIREIFLTLFRISKDRVRRVFALHGSFILFPKKIIETIGLPYDEDMFLFAEEAHLAHLLENFKIRSFITKGIEVTHKEDGSINCSDINEKTELRKSVMTYYEKLKCIK